MYGTLCHYGIVVNLFNPLLVTFFSTKNPTTSKKYFEKNKAPLPIFFCREGFELLFILLNY